MHIGGPGPAIDDKRPKRRRACLNCDRSFVTTAAVRLCPVCATRAAELRGGLGEMRLVGNLSERI